MEYDEDTDVIASYPCKAHEDAINCVTYIPELKLVATCAFDYHVFIWNAENIKPVRPFEKPNRAMPKLEDDDSDAFEENKAGEDDDDDGFNEPLPQKVGSLLLGNKVLPPDVIPDAEQRRYKAQWKVKIDKLKRFKKEMDEARAKYEEVKQMDYN